MSNLHVMINGLRGKMGQEIAAAATRLGVEIFPLALTSSTTDEYSFTIEQKLQSVRLLQLTENTGEAEKTAVKEEVTEVRKKIEGNGGRLIVIDFTVPSSVQLNWEFYCDLGLPFVMGTTGFDHGEMIKDTKKVGVYSVIAPNMCKQIVALQAMIRSAAKEFPGSFRDYKLDITESHQTTKVDTSGTAKAMLKYFNALCSNEMGLEDVNKIRDEKLQLDFGVPAEALKGHAWHTYTLTSGDGSVMFQFKHNVNGRRTYAEGVMDAVLFLRKKIELSAEERVFDMIDVLKAGSMR